MSDGMVESGARAAHTLSGRSSDVGHAVTGCDFPLVVWDLGTEAVHLANEPAAELVGLPLDALIGRRVTDLLTPQTALEATVAVMRAGAVEDVRVNRRVVRPGGDAVPVSIWTRTMEIDGRPCGLSLLIADRERPRLGRDPAQPWRDLAYAAVGVADRSWRIVGVSADIARILGGSPADWIGVSIPSRVDPDDRMRLPPPEMFGTTGPHTAHDVRVQNCGGGWSHVCVLAAPSRSDPLGAVAFAVLGEVPSASVERVAELELRLRQIGAEVRAAGVLDVVGGLPAVSDFPQLAELTTRQWEILSRLLEGDRVPTIASALYVSRSTVRNHLATVYAKFGVHSQGELIELLRGRARGRTD